MSWAVSYTNNVPTWTQSGTDTNLSGLTTAFNALPTVARSTAYTAQTFLKPPTPNGFWYRVSTAGTTAATAPVYGLTEGGTTTDGTAVLTAIKEPDIQVMNNGTTYFMTSWCVQINGTLTIANPMYETWEVRNWIIGGTGNYTSGTYASDGVTPLTNGVHIKSWQASTNYDGFNIVNTGGRMTLRGGVLWSGAIQTNEGSFLTLDGTDLVAVRAFGGESTFRVRNYSVDTVFKNVRTYGFGFDLFRMPTVPPTIQGYKSEYVYQYVGSGGGAGGANAYFKASSLANIDGIFDFDNYFGGWVELYNCSAGAALKVVCQYSGGRASHCVPLYQDINFTITDLSGVVGENARFLTTDAPTNSPTTTITTVSALKTWDFRSPLSYSGTADSAGKVSTSPVLQVWYGTTNQKNLRFPSSTANFKVRSFRLREQIVPVVLGSASAIEKSVAMVAIDNAPATEADGLAITGVTFDASGNATVTANLTNLELFQAWCSRSAQLANFGWAHNWTFDGTTLNMGANNLTVSAGATLTGSFLTTTGSVTLATPTSFTGLYTSSAGTSSIIERTVSAGSSVYFGNNATGVTTLFNSNVLAGAYRIYLAPGVVTPIKFARELYGFQRVEEIITPNGTLNSGTPVDIPDAGITQATLATVQAYTAIETASKFYDRTAAFRLTEQGIKLGQIATRSGTSIEIGTFSHVINQSAAAVYAISGSTITTKSTSYAGDAKYGTEIATAPATVTAASTEVITINIEDANGDSSVKIEAAGVSTFEIWKITDATNPDDYATGTLLDTTGIGTWRFIHADGYKMVVRDQTTNFRVVVEMEKGTYEAALFFGAAVQLAQADEVSQINTKMDVMAVNMATKPTLPEIEASTVLAKAASVDAIKVKTDSLTFSTPEKLDVNIKYVNGVEVKGTGEDNDPWNPV